MSYRIGTGSVYFRGVHTSKRGAFLSLYLSINVGLTPAHLCPLQEHHSLWVPLCALLRWLWH
jgi:hypothetical protein